MTDLILYTLQLADNALLLGQRNAEWTGHGPVLEQDIAISNISLDLVGQARNFYQYAAQLINESPDAAANTTATEDSLAFLRQEHEFLNCSLVELPRGDWGFTVLRQFFFSSYQYFLFEQLQKSSNAQLAAIAAKSLKEVAYHLRWSAEWVIRLGDGTQLSHQRMEAALQLAWPHVAELLSNAVYEESLVQQGVAVDASIISNRWQNKIKEVLKEATLPLPAFVPAEAGGKSGHHTPYLSVMLNEMQYLQRTYPNATW